MRTTYKKYSEKDREEYVKEFLRLKKQTGITKHRYAIEHEIPVSTFKRWVKLYLEYMDELALMPVENSEGGFIMLSGEEDSQSTVTECTAVDQGSEIRLQFKGAILEFHPEQLREVMEILRLW